MPNSSSPWLVVSATECSASDSMAAEPVIEVATNFDTAISALATSAATTTLVVPSAAICHLEGRLSTSPNPANAYAANTYSANAYAAYSDATAVAHTADATIVATTTPDRAADGNAANAKAKATVVATVATVATVVGGGRVAVAHVPITRGCITSSGIAITPAIPTGCG
jgi:hypothetical protein